MLSNLSCIVACDKHGAIGKGGTLPWRLADDLKFFKKTTMGATVVMGRKTYESIGKPLPGRTNVVLSTAPRPAHVPDSVVWLPSVESLINWIKQQTTQNQVFVIGGGEVYKLLMPYCTQVFLTAVDTIITNADTYFPLENVAGWQKQHLDKIQPSEHNEYAADIYVLSKPMTQ